MTNARISVTTGGDKFGIIVENIDFDDSRDKMALSIGRRIVDGLFAIAEEEGESK